MSQMASPCSNRQPARLRFSIGFKEAHAEPPCRGWEEGVYAMHCRESGHGQMPRGWGGLVATNPVCWRKGPALGAGRGESRGYGTVGLPHGSVLWEPAGSVCLHTHRTPRHGLSPATLPWAAEPAARSRWAQPGAAALQRRLKVFTRLSASQNWSFIQTVY